MNKCCFCSAPPNEFSFTINDESTKNLYRYVDICFECFNAKADNKILLALYENCALGSKCIYCNKRVLEDQVGSKTNPHVIVHYRNAYVFMHPECYKHNINL